MSFFPFKYFNKNLHGRDFVVGDLHGMFTLFESHLETLNFNPEIDRVFSVGDLVDRGLESYRVLEFLDKPWFFSIKGNHEMMLIEAKHKKTNYRSWIKHNGGGWWEDIEPYMQNKIRIAVSDLPVALEIATDIGKIGIVHADVPLGMTWQELVHGIHFDTEIRDYLSWSRNRYKCIQLTGETVDVEGIDLVVLGHTPMNEAMHINNLIFIDTGAVFYENEELGHLTILQIHPELEISQYPRSIT